MHKYISIIFLLLPIWLLASPFTLISESESELLLEFNLPPYSLIDVNLGGQSWQRLLSENGSVFGDEGHPQLLSYATAIGIPSGGSIRVDVVDNQTSMVRDLRLAPAQKLVLNGDEPDYVFYQDNRAYSRSALYPELLVSNEAPACVGDRSFVPLQVFPFRYRASNGELEVSNKIRLRVQIIGSRTTSPDWQISENPIDSVGDSFFINNASSRAWRVPRARDNSYQSPRASLNAINEIQLVIDKEGIYKITYDYIKSYVDALVDSFDLEMNWRVESVDPRNLELRSEDGQVPIAFYGDSDGSFDPGDYFEFFGDRHYGEVNYYDDYTSENVYTLSLVDKLGARMMVENGGLVNSNPSNYIVPDAYEHTVHLEQQLVSDKLGNKWTASNANYYREDLWFWKKISAPNLDIFPFELQYPKDTTIRSGSAKVMLHGLTYSESVMPGQWDHEATVRINQAMINSHTWTGQNEKLFENLNPVANTYFTHGTNYLYISLSGNTIMADREQVMLDWADVTYWREYKTSEDFIKFTKPSNRPNGLYQFQLEGFSSSDVSLYKIGSSVFSNLQIEPFNTDGIAPWTVTFQDSVFSTSVQFYAVTENMKMSPKQIRLNYPSDLRNPANSADVVVVSPRQFIEAEGTQALVSLWESEGHQVTIVDIQDIYDEFNNGIVSGEVIRDFARYAYNNWSSPVLQHLILLGEGVDDTRDNSPSRKYNLIPVKKTWTYKHGATASDNWFGCVVGDDIIADISIARLNVWTPEQILDYANKAISYRNEPLNNRLWNSHITLTAGGKIDDGNDIFSQQSERIRRKNIPDYYRVTRVYTTTQTVSDDYNGGTFNLKDAINSGTTYVQFMGHGGGRIWADYNLFNFNDVATLNNSTYPVFMSLACYASAFDTNGAASISEALVLQPNKGAIGTIGFSGLGYLDQDEDYGLALTEALFQHDFPTIGEALIFTKARFYSTTSSTAPRYALTNGTAYLGDPLIHMKKPIPGMNVTAQNMSLSPGDTLRVSAQFPQGVTAARLHVMKSTGKIVNVPFDLPVIQGEWNASYLIPASSDSIYHRTINVTGYSGTNEYVGLAAFGVGRPAIYHNALLPSQPTWQDSTRFEARLYSHDELLSMVCKVRTDSTSQGATWVELPMQVDDVDPSLFRTLGYLGRFRTGKEVFYKYLVNTAAGTTESPLYSLVMAGPDLILSDIQMAPNNEQIRLKVLVKNIGNAASIPTDLRLYYYQSGGNTILHSEQVIGGLGVNEERWDYVDLSGLPSANLTLEVRVNSSGTFSEWELFFNTNNIIRISLPLNFQIVGSDGAIIPSVDYNLSCEIPAGMIPTGSSSVFSVSGMEAIEPNNQPDIYQIKMRNQPSPTSGFYSLPYEVKTLDPSLVDSLGVFQNNKRIKLSFFYNTTDSLTQYYEAQNNYFIYRWDPTYQKWLKQGGNISSSVNKVVFEVSRQGIYTIFRNADRTGPSIDVNVQDQEFTIGGFVSGQGVISLLLTDANGINVVENTIKLFLNGEPVPETDYSVAINAENINRVPIKYQLDLPRGNYYLLVDCSDVNSNANTRTIQFNVNDEFDITNIGNYPNPVLAGSAVNDPRNDGRTRFTYILTDDADEVTIKVYTIGGRLVKTFSNLPGGVGYHEYPRTVYAWDCRDEQGFLLANGTYFYKVIARKGSRTIEKTMKMAILK